MDFKRIQRVQDVVQVNHGKVCRYCLDNSGLFDLNNEENRGVEIRDTILECIGIRVQPTDGLPAFLCWECEKEFFSYQRFRKKCLENYCILQLIKTNISDVLPESLVPPSVPIDPTPPSDLKATSSTEAEVIEAIEMTDLLPNLNEDFIIKEFGTHDYSEAGGEPHHLEEPPELIDEGRQVNAVVAEQPQIAKPAAPKRKEPTLRSCKSCDKTFTTQTALKKHTAQHHKAKSEPEEIVPILMANGSFQCHHCDLEFYEFGKLQLHERKVHNIKVLHVCEFCEKTFGDLCNYQRHKRIHTGEKPFKCAECSKEFSDNGNYNRHLRFHAGDLKYKCQFCDHGFISKWDLEKHLRVHSGERPFTCSVIDCGKAFKSAVELRTHSRIHSGERPHVCNICEKPFTAYGNLWRHKKKVHPEEHGGEKKRSGRAKREKIVA